MPAIESQSLVIAATETTVAMFGRRLECGKLYLLQCVQRMQSKQLLHHDGGEIDDVLQWVHRKPGPGANLDIV